MYSKRFTRPQRSCVACAVWPSSWQYAQCRPPPTRKYSSQTAKIKTKHFLVIRKRWQMGVSKKKPKKLLNYLLNKHVSVGTYFWGLYGYVEKMLLKEPEFDVKVTVRSFWQCFIFVVADASANVIYKCDKQKKPRIVISNACTLPNLSFKQ